MNKQLGFLALGATAMLGLMLSSSPANAATLSSTYGGFTVIEAEPFASGGTAENTTAVGGGFFSNPSATPDTTSWRDRTIGAFVTGYESLGGATDRVFDSVNAGPELVTTISGLAAGTYEVAVVYLHSTTVDDDAGLLANLNGVVDSGNPAHFYDRSEADVLLSAGSGWSVSLAAIGTTAGGATGFTVNIDENEMGSGQYPRSDYVGVAYLLVPEPSSIVLFGMGVVGLLLRRRQ
ncbi:MAG: PEP-CTERM sorting domain-containing protein [Planctomycetes bacterium]|nr:PEP-CTERM sorting domain-containing protein [Planctomycetota bacterium]